MQTMILRLDHDEFVQNAALTASASDMADGGGEPSIALVLESGAREQVIDELVDSIVRRYKRALDKLGRE